VEATAALQETAVALRVVREVVVKVLNKLHQKKLLPSPENSDALVNFPPY